MTIDAVASATLGDFNIGLAVAVGLVVPLSAQIDVLLSVGLGPFKADLSLQFNASLAAQATLSLQVDNPLAALQLALNALGQLQAALQAALSLPAVTLSISAELSAQAALAGALSARLGVLSLAISAAIKLKLAALEAAADLQASLTAGPVVAVAFSGEDFGTNGAKIAALFTGASVDGHTIPGITSSTPMAGGVVLATSSVSAAAAIGVIISV